MIAEGTTVAGVAVTPLVFRALVLVTLDVERNLRRRLEPGEMDRVIMMVIAHFADSAAADSARHTGALH